MKQRIAILLDSTNVSHHIHQFIRESEESEIYEVALLIINNKKPKETFFHYSASFIRRKGLKRAFSSLIFLFVSSAEKWLLRSNKMLKNQLRTYNIQGEGFEILDVKPKVSKSGLIYRYTENDIKIIKNMDISLIIRAGTGILRGIY